jgi:hypothetical protein
LKGSFLRSLPPEQPDQPAVVLFTSGSESLPKAVPLSHRNLICNIRGGIAHMDFRRRDALFGFLPPFHSFGLTATMLMPILSGIRVLHHADPTDARMLARMIAGLLASGRGGRTGPARCGTGPAGRTRGSAGRLTHVQVGSSRPGRGRFHPVQQVFLLHRIRFV